jgi:hypothetical protein
MTNLSRRTLAAAALVAAATMQSSAQQPPVNPDAKVLQEFKEHVDKYMELHNRLEKEVPKMKETKDPGKIRVSQDALASKIRAARAGATQGEIFTPDVQRVFHKLMYPEVKGTEGKETKQAIKDDAPKGKLALKVNAQYPDTEPLPTVPPNLLAALPKLPEDLEYRVVHKDLILRDVHANIIVDVMPNAIQ